MSDTTPTLHEEVIRKTYETIEKMESDRLSGRITNAQFGYGVDVLWSAVAGLADSDFVVAMELLEGHKRPVVTKFIFLLEPKHAVARIITDHKSKVTFTLFNKGQNATNRVYDYKDEINPLEHTKACIKTITKGLLDAGFSLL